MFKRLFFAFAVMMASSPVLASNLNDQAISPVVRINENCSAVVIDLPNQTNARLLTAKHCVEGKKEGFLDQEVFDGKKLVKSTKYYFEVDRTGLGTVDLALLTVRDSGFKSPTAHIADKLTLEEGDTVWTVGYPLGFTRTITQGLYNGVQVLGEELTRGEAILVTRASSNIDGGNSGGGLFQKNGENFELIGTTSMKFNANEFMGMYVTLNDIREFLYLNTKPSNFTKIDDR